MVFTGAARNLCDWKDVLDMFLSEIKNIRTGDLNRNLTVLRVLFGIHGCLFGIFSDRRRVEMSYKLSECMEVILKRGCENIIY